MQHAVSAAWNAIGRYAKRACFLHDSNGTSVSCENIILRVVKDKL